MANRRVGMNLCVIAVAVITHTVVGQINPYEQAMLRELISHNFGAAANVMPSRFFDLQTNPRRMMRPFTNPTPFFTNNLRNMQQINSFNSPISPERKNRRSDVWLHGHNPRRRHNFLKNDGGVIPMKQLANRKFTHPITTIHIQHANISIEPNSMFNGHQHKTLQMKPKMNHIHDSMQHGHNNVHLHNLQHLNKNFAINLNSRADNFLQYDNQQIDLATEHAMRRNTFEDDRPIPRSYSQITGFDNLRFHNDVEENFNRAVEIPVYVPRYEFSVFQPNSNHNSGKFTLELTSDSNQKHSTGVSRFTYPSNIADQTDKSTSYVVAKSLSVAGTPNFSPRTKRNEVIVPNESIQNPSMTTSTPENIIMHTSGNPINFPPTNNINQQNNELNTALETNGGSCNVADGRAVYRGVCSLLLARSACLPNHWLVLPQDGTAICQLLDCPLGTLKLGDSCVDPNDEKVCGEGQMLYVNLSGESECDCEPDHYYHHFSGKCYAKHDQGFCQTSFYLELNELNELICVANPCHQNGFVKIGDRCFKKNYEGICPQADVNPILENGTAECMEIIPLTVFRTVIQTVCPSGSKRIYFRQCRSVYRIPTQRKVPKKLGFCPQGFVGGINKNCRHTFSLFG